MSSLRSALQELRTEDVGSLGHEQLEADLQELERLSDVLLSEKARRIAVIDRRESWRKDGFTSCVAWAVGKLRMGHSRAKELVSTARALQEMPETKEALADGEVSSSAVAVLVSARERNPREFRASEAELLEKAERLPVTALRTEALAWGMAADGQVEAEERAERMYTRRRLDVALTVEGPPPCAVSSMRNPGLWWTPPSEPSSTPGSAPGTRPAPPPSSEPTRWCSCPGTISRPSTGERLPGSAPISS
jgi:hypothetical protein